MRATRFNPRNALILVIVLLLVCALLPAGAANVVSYVPRNAVGLATKPAHVLSQLTGGLRSRPRIEVDVATRTLDEAREKVLALQAENNHLIESLRELHTIVRQYERLASMVLPHTRFQDARARRGRPGRLILDKGSRHGIKPGLVVVGVTDSSNEAIDLVGRVTTCTTEQATVELITNVQTPLFVRMMDPKQMGDASDPKKTAILRHAGEVPMRLSVGDDGESFRGECPLRADVKVNYLAKLSEDPGWPPEAQGFIVGVVTDVRKDPDDPTNFKVVTVKPIRHLPDLSRVVVLVPEVDQ